ncbi:LOW QUALITY PROTEIN: hypothetical protein U9M48_034846 [Paspalum notatum var. saurae]|uniref:CCHC-type domain-containing protein n=1 Tax=Paspalum notatum var. saurae TaxID=547442 RepID=A0AAQ3UE45_PASNO
MSSPSETSAAGRTAGTNGAIELPMLTRANYHEWSLVMQVSLEALGLWKAVQSEKVERQDDRLALAAILRGVPSELKATLAVKETAKEAWAAVKTMRVGVDRVKNASKQRHEGVRESPDGESVDDFAVRVNTLVGGLRELGEEVKDGRVVRKVLRVVPKKWKQVAVSIEMLLDLDTMTMEELIGRLRVAEDADAEDAKEQEVGVERAGQLYLTEAQWEARRRERNRQRRHGGVRRGNGGDKRRSGGNDGDGDDERSDGDDDASSMASGSSRRGWSRNKGQCFECGGFGHIAKWCREKKKKEKALLADVEEATLL